MAFVANRLSKWTRVPDIIVLLVTGIALGTVLHWVDASKFGEVTHGFGTLALILILFTAGLEIDFRNPLKQFGDGTFLAFISYSLSPGWRLGVLHLCAASGEDTVAAGGRHVCVHERLGDFARARAA